MYSRLGPNDPDLYKNNPHAKLNLGRGVKDFQLGSLSIHLIRALISLWVQETKGQRALVETWDLPQTVTQPPTHKNPYDRYPRDSN